MLYFRLLYDFAAGDSVELAASKDEIVQAEHFKNEDGWLMVERVSMPSERGFVPIEYIKQCSGPPAAASTVPLHGTTNQQPTSSVKGTINHQSYTNATSTTPPSSVPAADSSSSSTRQNYPGQAHRSAGGGGHADNTSSVSLIDGAIKQLDNAAPHLHRYGSDDTSFNHHREQSHQGRRSVSATSASEPSVSQNKTTTGSLKKNTAFEGFLKNEAHYKQLVARRQEAMGGIKSALTMAGRDLQECKEKNVQLARRLGDLEGAMHKERQKWRQRVDEERQLIAQRSHNSNTSWLQ